MGAVATLRGQFSIEEVMQAAVERALATPVLRAKSTPGRSTLRGSVSAANIQPGLLVASHDLQALRDTTFQSQIGPALTCGILLEGVTPPLEIEGRPPIHHELHRATLVGFGEPIACVRRYRRMERNRAFGLSISKAFLERFDESVAPSGLGPLTSMLDGGVQVRHLPPSPRLTALATETLDHPYVGALSDLFLESAALRFIVEVTTLVAAAAAGGGPLRERGAERVLHAKSIIDGAIDGPPSVAELARQVGTNVQALQSGFRAALGTTVFGYVRDQRLSIARALIEDHGLPVAEAGRRVGYTSASAFTAAFRRRFGKSPSRHR